MTNSRVEQRIQALPVSEGAGVTVHRTIGTPTLRHLDPFLLLDYFGSDDPDKYIAGFPDHPHRGFVTLTYMLDGHMLHQDSMGNRGDLRSGGAQWMKAASGVIHSEMPQQSEGLMRGFQLWINLPAKEKMTDPAYQEFSPEAIPVVESAGRRVRLLSGRYGGKEGPIADPNTHVQYLDVSIDAGHRFEHNLMAHMTAFIFVFEGEIMCSGTSLSRHTLAVLSSGESIEVTAADRAARFILVAGLPLKEPIVQHGPFVMTTLDEIEQAVSDYRNNRLVQKKAEFARR